MKNGKKVNINIHIPDELHKRIKLEAAKREITIKELMIEVLNKKTKK